MTAVELKNRLQKALQSGDEDALLRQTSSGRLATHCEVVAGLRTLRAARAIRHTLAGHDGWQQEAEEMDRRARAYWNLYSDALREPRMFY
jgi:hypothetical protein